MSQQNFAGRYFLGLPLPESVCQDLSALSPTGDGLRTVSAAKMHVTLHFLGPLASTSVEAVSQMLEELVCPALSLTIQAGGQFPERGRARVLWAGVTRNDSLHRLHEQAGKLLQQAIGFVPEKRPFCPHVTLARCERNARSNDIEKFHLGIQSLEIANIPVDRLVLFRSQLQSSRTAYETVAAVDFR